jgi:hypothetical protein
MARAKACIMKSDGRRTDTLGLSYIMRGLGDARIVDAGVGIGGASM